MVGTSLCCRGVVKFNTLRAVELHGTQQPRNDFNQLPTSKTELHVQLKIMLKYLAQDHFGIFSAPTHCWTLLNIPNLKYARVLLIFLP